MAEVVTPREVKVHDLAASNRRNKQNKDCNPHSRVQ
jgi:hypothetical protein